MLHQYSYARSKYCVSMLHGIRGLRELITCVWIFRLPYISIAIAGNFRVVKVLFQGLITDLMFVSRYSSGYNLLSYRFQVL